MFGGHYGPSYAIKAARPGLSLGLLCLTTQLPDLLWSAFVLTGVERADVAPAPRTARPEVRFVSTPYSHSLAGTLGWAALTYAGGRRLLSGPAGRRHHDALLLAGTVLSHWLLDVVAAPRSLPLWGDSFRVGLGLQRHRPAAFLTEACLLLGPLALYGRGSPSEGTFAGRYGLALLGTLQLLLTALGLFTPPPRDVRTAAAGGLASFLAFAALAEWLSRRRRAP